MKKFIISSMAAATVMSGFVPAPPAEAVTPSAASSTPPIVFGACPQDLAVSYPQLTCADVQVPIDWANPGLGLTKILLSKSAARNPAKRRGTLIINPGGPGAGGAEYAGRLSKPNTSGVTRLPSAVLDSYDVIGMDPRGVAHSSPISCVDPSYWAGPQPDPDAQASRGTLWDKWSTFSDNCADNTGRLLAHMSTTDVARDIDWVRQGMGEAKISYLGFSYGTYLGAVYGKMYPNKVDRMILDGNVDPTPTQMWYEATLSQNAPVQRRLDSWLNWIAKYDDVYHLGTTTEQVRNAWNNTLADVRTNPRESVGATELLGTVYGAMFSESAWIPLAQALSDFVNEHDASSLVGFASPTNNIASENATASFNAVICSDAAWPTTQTQYESDVAASAQTSQFAWSNMWSSGSACANWAVPHKTRVMPTGENLPPILMFNSVDDPATPYEGARAMHAALPSSVLVTEQNSGKHCVFANPQAAVNPDAQQIGADYLVNGIIPDQDVSVPGHALPVPTPSLAQHSVKAPATSSALMQAE